MFKPMLAPNNDPLKDPEYFNKLRFPLDCSVKLDGIRGVVKGGVVKSRKYIDLPSRQVQRMFGNWGELDGEVIVGDERDADNVMNLTQSHVMSVDKPHPDVTYRVFDCADLEVANEPFAKRLEYAREMVIAYGKAFPEVAPFVSIVEHTRCDTLDELLAFENWALSVGYEGVMMRDPLGRYKHNRGTFKEGLIYKLKRFIDTESRIIGFEEGTTNTNPDIRDNLGNAKRSTAKEGMVLSGTLGKFIVDYQGQELRVAPGAFKHPQRLHIWQNQKAYLGKWLKYRYMAYGIKDLPRFPRAVSFRDEMDM